MWQMVVNDPPELGKAGKETMQTTACKKKAIYKEL